MFRWCWWFVCVCVWEGGEGGGGLISVRVPLAAEASSSVRRGWRRLELKIKKAHIDASLFRFTKTTQRFICWSWEGWSVMFTFEEVRGQRKSQLPGTTATPVLSCLFNRCMAVSAVGLSVLLALLLCYCIGKSPLTHTHTHSHWLSTPKVSVPVKLWTAALRTMSVCCSDQPLMSAGTKTLSRFWRTAGTGWGEGGHGGATLTEGFLREWTSSSSQIMHSDRKQSLRTLGCFPYHRLWDGGTPGGDESLILEDSNITGTSWLTSLRSRDGRKFSFLDASTGIEEHGASNESKNST